MKSIWTELSTRKETAPFILTNRVSQEAINLKRFSYINEAPRPGNTKTVTICEAPRMKLLIQVVREQVGTQLALLRVTARKIPDEAERPV